MRAGAAAGAILIEVSCVGVAGKNHGASVVGDAIVRVCGNISEELVHGVGGGLGGRGLLGTNGTKGDKEFVVDRTAVPQEGADNSLDAHDARIVKGEVWNRSLKGAESCCHTIWGNTCVERSGDWREAGGGNERGLWRCSLAWVRGK